MDVNDEKRSVAEAIFGCNLEEIIPELTKEDESLAISFGMICFPILKELVKEPEEIKGLLPIKFVSGKQTATALLTATTKRVIIIVPVKQLLGKVNFKDIRFVDYNDIEFGVEKKRWWGTTGLDITVRYRKIGTDRYRSQKYFVTAEAKNFLISAYHTYRGAAVQPQPAAAPPVGAKDQNAIDILKQRLASGEIGVEEYDRLKNILESSE